MRPSFDGLRAFRDSDARDGAKNRVLPVRTKNTPLGRGAIDVTVSVTGTVMIVDGFAGTGYFWPMLNRPPPHTGAEI